MWVGYGSEADPYAPVHRVKLEDIVKCPHGVWSFRYDGHLFDYLSEHLISHYLKMIHGFGVCLSKRQSTLNWIQLISNAMIDQSV